MRYIESTLITGEKIIVTPTVHGIVYFKPLVSGILFSLFLLIMGFSGNNPDSWTAIAFLFLALVLFIVIWLVIIHLYYRFIEMAVTNKRVVCKTGIISVHSEELQWNRIESIEIRQGLLGRLFNFGDIYFSGTGTSYVRFGFIRNPWDIKSKSAEILSK